MARPPCPSGCPTAQGAWVLPPSWFSRLHCSNFCAPLLSTVGSKGLFLKLGGDAAQQTQPSLWNSGNLSRTHMEFKASGRDMASSRGGGQLSSTGSGKASWSSCSSIRDGVIIQLFYLT